MEEEKEKDMTPILLEDLGMRFTSETKKYKRRYGLYQCQYCGKEFECIVHNIKNGHTKSCGCQSTKYKNPHGLTKHRLYKTWAGMTQRCNNPKYKKYKDYGARGIQVCGRWMDINNFIEDMYPSWEEGLSIDRIDVNGNYEPDNCRWTTRDIQSSNTRELTSRNKSGYRGVYYHKAGNKWVATININYNTVYLGLFETALEGAKAYERYVRLNNLEHNFTPALTKEEIKDLELKQKNGK